MSDYLAYQLKEIERIAPHPGEDEALEAERKLLAHAEKLLASSAEAYTGLYESDQSVLSRLTIVRKRIQESSALDRRIGQTLDAIDAGISGRVAEAVGRRLHGLARGRQILCVTHQPQIARFADYHLRVMKSVRHKRTMTAIEVLDGGGRIGELARLIGGAETVETAREAARWLLETATQERRARATKS